MDPLPDPIGDLIGTGSRGVGQFGQGPLDLFFVQWWDMLEGAENRARWRRVFRGKEVEEESIIDLKGGSGVGYGGKPVRRLSNSQPFSCPDGLGVYCRQEQFPVGGLCLLDSMKVLILKVFRVAEVGGSRELSAPTGG